MNLESKFMSRFAGEVPSSAQPAKNMGSRGDQRLSILLAEMGAAALPDSVATYLEDQNIYLAKVFRREEITRQIATRKFRMMILCVGPGDEGGFDMLRTIRSRSDLPVIVIASGPCAGGPVRSLELGADDYLAAPFGCRELLARIRALLRGWKPNPVVAEQELRRSCHHFGGWQLDCRMRHLINPKGVRVLLSKMEYALLMTFLGSPQKLLTRSQLTQAMCRHANIADRTVDVQVLRLRRKLEASRRAPRVILTEHGLGYVFALPVVSS